MEDRLAVLTGEMRGSDRRNSQELLADLTELAADLEAQAASSLFRFGASRAYYDIVHFSETGEPHDPDQPVRAAEALCDSLAWWASTLKRGRATARVFGEAMK